MLPAPDGTLIHPRAAEPTKLSSSHNRPAPEAVTSARADGQPTGAHVFRAFLRHCQVDEDEGVALSRRLGSLHRSAGTHHLIPDANRAGSQQAMVDGSRRWRPRRNRFNTALEIDKYEVRNEEFERFVDAGGYQRLSAGSRHTDRDRFLTRLLGPGQVYPDFGGDQITKETQPKRYPKNLSRRQYRQTFKNPNEQPDSWQPRDQSRNSESSIPDEWRFPSS